MKLTIFVIFLGLVLVFSGFSSGPPEEESTEIMDGEMGKSTGESGALIDFTTIEEARMAAEKGPVVLFFSAAWCPTCRTATADIASRREDLGDLTIIVLDYDTEKQMKAIYGVAYQHTFVQIDGDGEVVSLWNGGGVDRILDNVTRREMN